MSSFYNYISLAEHFVPILMSFYLGSWSDHWGRKPFIYMTMTGMLLSSMMNLMNAIFLKEWDKWIWLISVVLSKNVFAGQLGFYLVVYSFISDNSRDRERTLRLAILSFTWHITQPAGGPVGAWLLVSGGYVCVFSASLLIMSLAFSYMMLRLWSFQEKCTQKENLSLFEHDSSTPYKRFPLCYNKASSLPSEDISSDNGDGIVDEHDAIYWRKCVSVSLS